jgi:hypothetical protein
LRSAIPCCISTAQRAASTTQEPIAGGLDSVFQIVAEAGDCFRLRCQENEMAEPAERMRMRRARRRRQGLRELHLVVPDARSEIVRARIATQVAKLNPDRERDALVWVEAISEFDTDQPR